MGLCFSKGYYRRANHFVLKFYVNPSPAEPRYTLPLQTVDPDQMASVEAN